MKNTAFKKVLRDLLSEKRRSLTVLLAIIIGVFAVAMLSSSKSLLRKNLSANYLQTNPASFSIIMDSLNPEIRKELLALSYIEDVEVRQNLPARLSVGNDEHVPVKLFLIEDFTDTRINTFNLDEGKFPTSNIAFMIERQGVKLTELAIGENYKLQIPNYKTIPVNLSGFAHDPGVAPSWMEGMLYAYLPQSALPTSYISQLKTDVKFTVAQNKYDIDFIEQKVVETKAFLAKQGINVYRTEVPKPGVHMHQRQMNALMFLVFLFGILTLILSSFLVINMISAIMAKEIKQIALMKATGATAKQITSIYLFTIGIMAMVGIIIATPLGLMAGKAFADFNASMLNFVIYDASIGHDVIFFYSCHRAYITHCYLICSCLS